MKMTSRETILNKIKQINQTPANYLPSYDNFGITYDNKYTQFSFMLETVGGKSFVSSKEELDALILSLYKDEKNIVSNVKECSLGNFKSNDINDPHDLKDVDLAIVKGEFAIAENGAVWVKNQNNKHRALYFIAQHIVLVVKKDQLINNMHEAYEKISFEEGRYGVFISGPSKTADIEQALVIGAHGPKTGYVIFID